MSNLDDQIKEKESKVAELSQRMIKYGDEVKRLEKVVDEREGLHRDAILKLNNIKSEIAKAEDSLKQLNDGISEKHDKFLGLDQEKETATGEYLKVLEGHKEDIQKKKDEVYKLVVEIDSLNSDIKELQSDLDSRKKSLTSSNNSLDAKIEENEASLEKLKKEIKPLASERKGLIERIGNLQNTKDGLDQEISGSRENQSSLKRENEKLIQENERLSLAIEAIDDELIKKKEEITAEESRLDEKKIENTEESDRLDAVRTSLDNKALEVKYAGMRLNKLIKKHRMEDEFEETPA